MARIAPVVRQTFDLHRQRLERVINRTTLPRLQRLYEQAQAEATRRLRELTRTRRGETFTAHVQRQVVVQLRQGQVRVASALATELHDTSRTAQVESVHGLISDVSRLHREFTGADVVLPIEEAARFAGVIDARRTSLLRMHETSMRRYGAHLVSTMESQLALSMAQAETVESAIDRVESVARVEWWQAERIGRTETAWAFNASHSDAVEEVSAVLPGLMQRWSEHVDDATGAPLDDRVAVDSLVMHGQVAPPGGVFTMPSDPRVPEKVWNLSWSHPPNRPNDRAVLQPWMKVWGVPGWVLRAGRRVDL